MRNENDGDSRKANLNWGDCTSQPDSVDRGGEITSKYRFEIASNKLLSKVRANGECQDS